jgi:predicted dehydrogenase
MADELVGRRTFLKTAALGAAGAAGLSLSAPTSAHGYSRILGANDRVRVGIVGFSDRTRGALIGALQEHAEELNFEITALSDIWNLRREEGLEFLREAGAVRVQPYRNNEEMYEARTTDAVIIGTADFQHALHGIEALEAGQHAYLEKPLANTMEDARAIRDAVRRTGKVVQNGTQRRSARNYELANQYLRSGEFGEIVMAEMTWNVNQPGRWRRPELVGRIREQDTDWRRYLMNRPYEPWDPRKYLEYRLFWPYSSGIPDQWMVHQIDTVHWFTGLPRPRSVVANGGIYTWHDGRTNWDTATMVFDYGPLDDPSQGFQVVYSSRMNNSAGGVKELYYSNAGMLDLDRNEITATGGLEQNHARAMGMQENRLTARTLEEVSGSDAAADPPLDATSANMRNWMECIRSGQTPNADIEAGYNHSVALCMTIAAIQTGKKVTFDDERQEVVVS